MRWSVLLNEFKSRWQKKPNVETASGHAEILSTDSASYLAGPFPATHSHVFVDFDLEIDISWENSRKYRYSKLYFSGGIDVSFDEDHVICFRIEHNRRRHRVRIRLPDAATDGGEIRLRLDPVPYTQGRFVVYECSLVSADNQDNSLSEAANIDALKQRTRAGVEISENEQREIVSHYPESLSLELQPGCNLQCSHCATHGIEKAHAHNNRLGPIEPSRLQALANEVFPHLTLLHLVGRGEPLMVSDDLWNLLVNEARRNRLLLTIVTNGSFIERRITRDVLPLIDTLTISIDGFSPDVFASNRGGASFEKAIRVVRYYHDMRKSAGLPRRPKLCISWTLKKNNISELPDFVRFMEQFEPDRYYLRHLLVSHDKDKTQSLLNVPEIANRFLAEAYELMAKMDVETDCPPLIAKVVEQRQSNSSDEQIDTYGTQARTEDREKNCHYIHRTASIKSGGTMTTCAVYHAAAVGTFSEDDNFLSLWNGDTMRKLRRDINTPNEWNQCRNCWFRESHFKSQRLERANNGAYSLLQKTTFSEDAWDYRTPKPD